MIHPPKQLPALTSLRFAAALAVLLFHVPYVLPNSVGTMPMPQGSLGVSFFFVLSGFILRHTQAPQGFRLGSFYRRRAARVLPLHYATLLVWIWLFFAGWGNSLTEKINSGVANVLVIHSLFSGPLFTLGYNAVSWSISVELFFYALFPLLLPGRRAIWAFLAIVAIWLLLPLTTVAALDRAFPNFFYFHPAGRLLEFTGGIALHALWRHFRPGEAFATAAQLGAILLLVLLLRANLGLAAQLANLVLLVPFCAIILAFAWDGPLTRLLSHPVPVLLGEASFALYMTHHMLFRLLDPMLTGWGPVLAFPVALATAVGLSVAVFLLFENPVRAMLSRPSVSRDSRAVAAQPVSPGGGGG